jgi:hypothetical protein
LAFVAAVETDEQKKHRVRQQERTVDNLNRLFAMLFSIIFSLAAASLLDRIVSHLKPPYRPIDLEIFCFTGLAIAILGTTAAIFFHQASRGLDLQYGASAELTPHRSAFLFDYLVIVLTMVPFALMSKALDKSITDISGFFLFFVSHELLIVFGLMLLIIRQLRMQLFPRSINPEFLDISTGVDRYWFLMNSTYLFLTAFSFFVASGGFYSRYISCPLFPHHAGAFPFMVTFFALATARNGFDYFWMWNVFFPVRPAGVDGSQVYWFPLKQFIEYRPNMVLGVGFSYPIIAGYLVLSAAMYIIITQSQVYNLFKWTNVCS